MTEYSDLLEEVKLRRHEWEAVVGEGQRMRAEFDELYAEYVEIYGKYVHPYTIVNLSHGVVIQALIVRDLAIYSRMGRQKKDYQVAKDIGISPSRLSEIKNDVRYQRAEWLAKFGRVTHS